MNMTRTTLFAAAVAALPAVATASSDYHATLYGGQGTRSSIHEILFQTEFEDSWFVGAGIGKTLATLTPDMTLEAEGNVLKHMGRQHHWETAAAPMVRWHTFPWNDTVATTFGIGLGLSYATHLPVIEQEKNGKSNTLLVFLPVEVTLAPEKDSKWEGVMRIHHRSGAWGVVGPRGGSNFATAGLRYHF